MPRRALGGDSRRRQENREPDDLVRLLFDPGRTVIVSPPDDSIVCGCASLQSSCLTAKELGILQQMVEAWLQTDFNPLCTDIEAQVIWLKIFGRV